MTSNLRRRLERYDYASPGVYFVTFCTRNRIPILGAISSEGEMTLSDTGEACQDAAHALERRFAGCSIEGLVIMPDHVHALIGLGQHDAPSNANLSRIIGWWKSRVSSAQHPLWQRSFYDRIVRDETELQEIRKYIQDNPKRWVLKMRGEL